MATNKKHDVIDLQVCKGRQDVTYKEVLQVDGKRLQIKIKSDSVDFQSYAVIKLWSKDAWNSLHEIHYSLMATGHELIYTRDPDTKKPRTDEALIAWFAPDRNELLRVGLAICE